MKKTLLVTLAVLAGMLYAQQASAEWTCNNFFGGTWTFTYGTPDTPSDGPGAGSYEVTFSRSWGATTIQGEGMQCYARGRRKNDLRYLIAAKTATGAFKVWEGADNTTMAYPARYSVIQTTDMASDNLSFTIASASDRGSPKLLSGIKTVRTYGDPTDIFGIWEFTIDNSTSSNLAKTNKNGIYRAASYGNSGAGGGADTFSAYFDLPNWCTWLIYDQSTYCIPRVGIMGAFCGMVFTVLPPKPCYFSDYWASYCEGDSMYANKALPDCPLGPAGVKNKTNAFGLVSARRACQDKDNDTYGVGDCDDYYNSEQDCNDADKSINPGAADVTCDGIDQNCDGNFDEGYAGPKSPYYRDADSDGFGAGAPVTVCSANPPAGYVADSTDCNDGQILYVDADSDGFGSTTMTNCGGVTNSSDCNDAAVVYRDADGDGFGYGSPVTNCAGAGYVTNSSDCDDAAVVYRDADGDGFGYGSPVTNCAGAGYVTTTGDCNDGSAAVNPGEAEVPCNGIDDNCNGEIDEGDPQGVYYRDADNDTFGNVAITVLAGICATPSGYSTDNTDCDDTDNLTYPGAQERCNGKDDDCNGVIDTDNASLPVNTFYKDADSDGFGNAAVTTLACAAPDNYTSDSSDCNDGQIQYIDADSDGFGSTTQTNCGVTNNTDCNDSQIQYVDADSDGFGSTTQTNCGVANTSDCDDTQILYVDADSDGFGSTTQTNCGVANTSDCDDTQVVYRDADRDGFGAGSPVTNCVGTGYVTDSSDCDDTRVVYADADGDTYGAGSPVPNCVGTGFVANSTDCKDNNSAINPGATEVCNGLDDNCAGGVDEGVLISFYLDADGDGYGTGTASTGCTVPSGYASASGDCDDADAKKNPSNPEIIGNGIDDDCNGLQDESAPGSCYYWKGKWEFTYKNPTSGVISTDNITITSTCANPNASVSSTDPAPACMTGSSPLIYRCQAKGTRSDGSGISINQVYMDARLYGYYETQAPGADTPWDAVYYRDFANEVDDKAGYKDVSPFPIDNCTFDAAEDGSFIAQTSSGTGPYKSTFGLVSGKRLNYAYCSVVDNCTDADGDGYGVGSGCLGTDCNDSDNSCHTGDCCDNITCELKVIPQKLRKVISIVEPFKVFVLIGEKGTEFARTDKPEWCDDSIRNILKVKFGKRIIIAFVVVNPFGLEEGDCSVIVGDCEGSIEIK